MFWTGKSILSFHCNKTHNKSLGFRMKGAGGGLLSCLDSSPSRPVCLRKELFSSERKHWWATSPKSNCKILPFLALLSVNIFPPSILEEGIHILKRMKISCILAGRSKLNPCLKVSPSSNTWNYICHEDISLGPSKSSRLEANHSLFLTIFPQMR